MPFRPPAKAHAGGAGGVRREAAEATWRERRKQKRSFLDRSNFARSHSLMSVTARSMRGGLLVAAARACQKL